MKHIVARWLLPVVLAFGLAGNAAANGHEHESGDGFTQTFSKFFLNDAGQTFGKVFDFKIDGGPSLVTLKVATFDLEDMTISIFNKKSGIAAQTFSFDDFLNTSFSLNPGKYFAFFTGTVSSDMAGFAAAASAVPVPEPAEWMMILAGVAMMGVVVSRRRNT